ncbi:cytochrome P450 [Polymorphospora sp. NPDC051019]|uniref:cytochrome P450 n=1 Tax=Polymorphospora sp. NPDC051019 TaxID=3155725 RepID=UPI00342885DC
MTATEARPYPFSTPRRLDAEPLLATLRTQTTIRVRLPYGEPAWLITRYEDVKLVLSDPRFSRAAGAGRDQPRMRPFFAPPGSIMDLDPPDHSRLRRLVAKAFTVRRIEQLRPRAQQVADELVDAMVAKGPPADLVEDFALQLPVTVICDLLGVPEEDRATYRMWSEAFVPTTRYAPEKVRECLMQLSGYLADLIAQRGKTPTDDLLGALVAARDNDDRLGDRELLGLVQSMILAGHETTASQITNFVYVLLTHPNQLAELRADPGLLPRAVEELQRFIPLSVLGAIPRYALADVELNGVLVKAGDAVLPVLPSANRDESVYTDPERLDLRRAEATHLNFGHGPHHCLGAPLARMELQVALGTLLKRLPGLRIAGPEADIEWKDGLGVRGPADLPISWDGTPGR